MQLNDGSIQATGSDEGNRRDMQQGCKIVPGDAYNRISEYKTPLAEPVKEIQVHNKAARMLCVRYRGMNMQGFNSLVILDTYLTLFRKQTANKDDAVDWSGANNDWKRKVFKGIEQGANEGIIKQEGSRLSITAKGYQVLEDYNSIFEEAKEIYINKAAAALNKPKRDRRKKNLSA